VPDALVLDNTRKLELPELAIAALQARPDWNSEYSKLRDEIGSEPLPTATRERAVLKIQDGCNHKCSYCIIPTVRGSSTTKTRDTILSEARAFVREGARELTVTGVSMSDWGAAQNRENQSSRNAALCDLLRAVAKIDGLERVRVSSLDPADVDDEFLHTVANTPKVCPHIHLALQAGSAATLRRMRRRYTPEMFLRAAKRWREIRPDGGLTTDVIVGFPGETAEDFEESMNMARQARFSAIHVFPYSPRAGTVAASLPHHVAPAEQKRRVDALLQLARKLSVEYAAQFLEQTLPVLVEAKANGTIEGMTPHYVKARLSLESSTQDVAPGDVLWMRATTWSDDTLHGIWQPRLGRE
jgi:threonylcarbamoyladenosine tRNA methylthiotransferase MtaB